MTRKKGEQTRQRFLDTTERLIQKQGLTKVTTKIIAQEAGYSEATLYLHFGSKENLLLAVIQRYLPAPVDTFQVGQKSVEEHLEDLSLAAMNFYQRAVPVVACVFADAELLTRHQESMRIFHREPRNVYEQISRYIEAEQRIGRISSFTDPQSCAALLLGACFQYVFYSHFWGELPLALTNQQLIKRLVQTMVAGIDLTKDDTPAK